ncbi:MAG: hypothetical protein E7345_02400 [Clostridiales bacterium]|nr:hypothetical protein [Clostridiales bacterium]
MEKKKFLFSKFCLLVIMLALTILGGFFMSACDNNKFEISVIYEGAEPELKLPKQYQDKVRFKDSYSFSFVLTEGYDHTGISAKLVTMDGNNIETPINYQMVVLDENDEIDEKCEIDEEHLYSTKRKFTYSIENVNRNLKVVVDLSGVHLKTFDVTLNGVLSEQFSIAQMKPFDGEYLTSITNDNLYELEGGLYEKSFNAETNSVTLSYGTSIILLASSPDSMLVDKFYCETPYFDYLNQTKFNDEYSFISIAEKGHTYYTYEDVNNVFKKIYYIGAVKENLTLYKTLPGYKEQTGFKIESIPNVFNLFTPSRRFNGDTFSLEVFSTGYDKDNCKTTDTIGEETIGLIEPSSTYYRKYDIYNLYVGNNLASDSLLNADEKTSTYEDLYIRYSCDEDLKDVLNILLISEEEQKVRDPLKNYDLIVPEVDFDLKGNSGYLYAKIDKELLGEFIVDVPYQEGGETLTYKVGNSIVYPEYDEQIKRVKGHPDYFIVNASLAFQDNVEWEGYNIAPYIIDEHGNKDYGLLDYHVYPNANAAGNENDTHKGKIAHIFYINKKKLMLDAVTQRHIGNLYIEVLGPEAKGIFSPKIGIVEVLDTNVVASGMPNEDNIVTGLHINKRVLWDDIFRDLALTTKINTATNFGKIQETGMNLELLNLPSNPSEILYFTNDFDFTDENKMDKIYYANKKSVLKIGGPKCLYYVSTLEDDDYDFDIYFVRKDGNGEIISKEKISKTSLLKDITGKKIRMEVMGRMRDVYAKYLVSIYDYPSEGIYYLDES